MLLGEMIINVRLELGDKAMVVWTDNDEITRAIGKSVSLLSRLTPKRDLVEGTLLDAWIEDKYLLDISDVLSDYIKIEKVEYPTDMEPPPAVTFDVVGDYLKFREDHTLTAGKVIRIIYLGKWTPPTPSAEGDYPLHLDDVIIIGSAGQALIFKAEEYTYKVISTLNDAITAIDAVSAITFPSAPDISTEKTAAETALTAAIAQFAAAVTSLGSMDSPLGDTATALDAIDTELSAAIGYLADGDSLINAATRGADVGKTFGAYAGHRADIASGYEKEAAQRVALALAYEAKAARQGTLGNSYVNEAVQRVSIVSRLLDKFASEVTLSGSEVAYYKTQLDKVYQLGAIAGQYLKASGRYLASGQAKINEFLAALGIKPEISYQKASAEQRV